MGRFIKSAVALVLVLVVAAAGLGLAMAQGWLSPFGIKSETNDSQVIQTIEKTQEVSLLALGIQGITDQEKCREAFGRCVPGSTEKYFIQYNFTAKLGVDGTGVAVEKTAENSYTVSLPAFTFIGYEQPTFKEAATDGGVLTWFTPDIDPLELVNTILSDEAQAEYVDQHEDYLVEQAKVFYDTLIKGLDPEAEVTYEFSA